MPSRTQFSGRVNHLSTVTSVSTKAQVTFHGECGVRLGAFISAEEFKNIPDYRGQQAQSSAERPSWEAGHKVHVRARRRLPDLMGRRVSYVSISSDTPSTEHPSPRSLAI